MKKTVCIFAIILMILAFIVQLIGLFTDPASKTVAVCYFICIIIVITFLFKMKNEKKQKESQKISLRFILFGSIAAALVEILFWAVELLVGSEGVAAHPNILVDLALLMPWYTSMITLFWFANKKCGFSFRTTFLLGGLYEFVADGIVGHILGGNAITIEYIITLPLFFGVFVFVYFPMLAMPLKFYNIVHESNIIIPPFKKLLYALLPMVTLLPYSFFYLLILAP